jgi:hypothetical protein
MSPHFVCLLSQSYPKVVPKSFQLCTKVVLTDTISTTISRALRYVYLTFPAKYEFEQEANLGKVHVD